MEYPEHILKFLRLRAGLEENDTTKDAHFNTMQRDAVLEEVLSGNGLPGRGAQVKDWIAGIYDIDLDRPRDLYCTDCKHLDAESAPCAYCIRSKPDGDYYCSE